MQAWTPPGRGLAQGKESPPQRAIRVLDAWLRRKLDFIEFSANPTCMIRVVVTRADCDVRLSDGSVVKRGDPIIDIHFWNERVPQTSACQGLGWGGRFGRQLMRSFSELAHVIDEHPRLCDAVAVRGRLAFSGARNASEMHRFGQWFGFESAHAGPPSLLRRVHDAAEDIWLLALAWTFNPGSLRTRAVIRRRDDLWISRAALIQRYVVQKPPRRAS